MTKHTAFISSTSRWLPILMSNYSCLKLIVFSLSVFLFFFISNLEAQHYQFSQFYSARTYLNPAFTGLNACSKLSMTYRDQWPSVPGSFITSQVSFESSLGNSGLGLLFFTDKSGYGGLSSTLFSALYSYEVSINRKIRLRFGANAGGVSRKINYEALLFGDQIKRGGSVPTVENPTHAAGYLDLSSGILCYTKKRWLGISGVHLTQPDQALVSGHISKLPMELRVHGGERFYKKAKSTWENEHYTLVFNYKMQLEFDQLDIGMYYTLKPLNIGVWYRGIPLLKAYKPGYGNNDALAFLVGLNTQRLFIGYSYDLTISKLTHQSGGAHELSVSYNFCDNKRKKVKTIVISCPKF